MKQTDINRIFSKVLKVIKMELAKTETQTIIKEQDVHKDGKPIKYEFLLKKDEIVCIHHFRRADSKKYLSYEINLQHPTIEELNKFGQLFEQEIKDNLQSMMKKKVHP